MSARTAIFFGLIVATPASPFAQAPPPEIALHVLMDAGPVPAPATCGCVTAPFTLLAPRPGWGYGGGPAAPETSAPPSALQRTMQKKQDAEDIANLQRMMEDAASGNSHAAFGLGLFFTTGTAVQRDDAAALLWLTRAARGSHPNAYVQLGHRYLHGVGVQANDRAAAYWFYQGALIGDRGAMVALGSLYAAGRGIDQNWTAALYWWEKAGHWRFLGDAYACGLGVPQDDRAAFAMYVKGAKAGDISSTIQVGHMHAGACAERPDDGAAFAAYTKAADQGYPEAQIALSLAYLEGRGVTTDAYHAYVWARLAELRLEPGELRRLAAARAATAARQLTPFLIEDADKFVASLIQSGATPMNR